MYDYTDPDVIYHAYLRAVGAVTRYVQGVQDKTRKPNSDLYRTLQTQANQLHRQVYGR